MTRIEICSFAIYFPGLHNIHAMFSFKCAVPTFYKFWYVEYWVFQGKLSCGFDRNWTENPNFVQSLSNLCPNGQTLSSLCPTSVQLFGKLAMRDLTTVPWKKIFPGVQTRKKLLHWQRHLWNKFLTHQQSYFLLFGPYSIKMAWLSRWAYFQKQKNLPKPTLPGRFGFYLTTCSHSHLWAL